MTSDEAAATLASRTAERDRIQANLLDLDGSFGKRLLAGAVLGGVTKTRWEDATADLATLWETFTAYSAVIDRSAELAGKAARRGRGGPELTEVTALLSGPSVQVSRPLAPLGRRALTESGDDQITVAAAVRKMTAAFGRVAEVVTAAETVWNELTDRLETVTTSLGTADRESGGLRDEALAQTLGAAAAELAALRGALATDPLSFWNRGQAGTERIDRLERQVAGAMSAAGELARLRADADRRIAATARAIAEAQAAEQDAIAARDAAAEKIAAAALPATTGATGATGAMASQLAGLDALRSQGRWRRLAAAIEALEGQAAAATRGFRDAEQAATALLGRARRAARPSRRLPCDGRPARRRRGPGPRRPLRTGPRPAVDGTMRFGGRGQGGHRLSAGGHEVRRGKARPMTACAQPGCAGTIEDGYCGICGLAAASPVSRATAPQAVVSSSRPSASVSVPVSRGTSVPVSRGTSVPVSRGTHGSRSSTGRSARGHLGAGLVEVPPVPARDPSSAVLKDPQVAEKKRFCGSCGRPVGRGRDGTPGRSEGFCRNCGTRFSFRPKLQTGELVGGQYEILGCLAHGGLGWIYLSRDRNVSDRWVVLKGLLDIGDADAQAAAVAERRFLAEVEHPNIVRIYNFVQHSDRQTGEIAGYIVMEYVGGKSLKQIALDRRKTGGPLPLDQALAYAIEVLPALGYLHSLGLVYCDFKPDNVIQMEEQLKLIDMGGVRRIDDQDSPIYGTTGYQAPEIATAGPSPSSDLYTVARTLAVLTLDFTGYTTTYKHSLPDPAKAPLLAQQESFGRLLRRATHEEPQRRFIAASDMAEQLTGVLREVLAKNDGHQRPALSSRFSPELRAIGAADAARVGEGAVPPGSLPSRAEVVAGLPVPQVDGTDPATSYLAALSTLGLVQQADALQLAVSGAPGAPAGLTDSIEAHLALARVRLTSGDVAGAKVALEELIASGDADWRVTWYLGMCELADGGLADARAAFEAVYDNLPGELAPKLALALAAEAAGDREAATRYFRVVWTVDHAYVSAAFGLARMLIAAADQAGAVDVLASVPETSSHYVAAQIGAVRAWVCGRDPARLTVADLQQAGGRLVRLQPDTARRESLTIEILQAALSWVTAGNAAAADHLLGCDLTDRDVRFGLERGYRALARLAPGAEQRIGLVNLANDVRPRTWW